MKHALTKTFFALAFASLALGSAEPAGAETFVATNTAWKYLDNGTDPGTAWRAPAFNDSAWASGLTPMGYEDSWIVTTNSFGPDANNKYITTYYRRTFTLEDATAYTNLLLRVQRDDGVVVYLNGTEVLRDNLPPGDITSATAALTAIGGTDETTFVKANPSASLLVSGPNVLAVEMHQSGPTSSDLSFDLELSANFTPVNPVVEITSPADNSTLSGTAVNLIAAASDVDGAIAKVEFYQASLKVGEALAPPYRFTVTGLAPGAYTFSARAFDSTGLFTDSDSVFINLTAAPPTLVDLLGAPWKYLVTSTAAPADWLQPAFNDSSWSEGPSELGYGDADEATTLGFGLDTNNKYPTTYFRKTITIADPAAYASMLMTVRYDDGYVVYVNGTEIHRLNMPDGVPSYSTLATTASDYSDDVFSVPTSAFVAGQNILAVEMHQGSANSSDISFALQLQGVLPPTVAITSPANGASFSSPVSFDLTASASDADGAITKVEFFDGGVLLGSVSAPPYRVPVSNLIEGGHVLTAVATDNSGATATSDPVSITVVDPNPPLLIAASATTNKITVVYSKRVLAPSATTIGNYSLTPAASIQSVQFGATENIVVINTSSTLSPGVTYTLRVDRVQGSGGTVIAPNSTIDFEVIGFTFGDVGGPAVPGSSIIVPGGLDVTGAGSDINGTSDQFQFSYEADPRVGDFDVRVRVAGLAGSDLWAKAGLMARESLTGGSRYAAAFATPGLSGAYFQYRLAAAGGTTNAGAAPVTYPNTWLRLKRDGNLFTGYVSVDGSAWGMLGSMTIPMPAGVYVGLAVTSRDSSRVATAQFREFGNVSGGTVSGVVYDREPLGPSSRRSGLVFSEIMYNPRTTNALEFIEIYNSNPFFEELTGYRVSGAIDYAFPAGTRIAGGAFLVIARNPSALQAQYGLSGVLGPWVGATTNGLPAGGRLRLRGKAGSTMLDVNYGTRAPWPVAADGAGHSLVLARPSYGEADPRAWAASDAIGGSPGRPEPFSADPLRNVVINEFLANTDFPQEDYLELYNHGNQPVDLSNAYLTDDPRTNKFRIPPGTILPARGFVSFIQTTQTFALSSGGERVYLVNSNASRVIDAINFGPQETGVSMGRVPDGAPEFYRLAALTPGAANGPMRSEPIVINEIMYGPISGDSDDEYVELYNRTAGPVSVGRWRFVDGIDFTLPTDAVIPANGYLVVAKNRARLLANYPNLDTNNTVGNYDGTLANGGERLSLGAPIYTITTNTQTGVITTNIDHYIVSQVTYGSGGRWGWWSHGGGSSLELKDPNADIRQPANWADSDETSKGVWTTVELSGTLGESLGSPVNDSLQIYLQGVGECLVDEVEVRNNAGAGPNLVSNPGFETGTAAAVATGVDLGGWVAQGSHDQSSFESTGFNSSRSLHLRAGSRGDNGGNRVRSATFAATSPVLIRAKVKWLRGWPEIMFRIHGGTFDVGARLQVQPNLGTPGAANSRRVTNAGPAIFDVVHAPILPDDSQPVVVTARASDPGQTFTLTLKYRQDPATTFTSAAMNDTGTGGDSVAGDGVYSATIPGRPAGTVVAFYIESRDSAGGVNTFPQELFPAAPLARMFPLDAPAREAVIRWGDRIMPGSLGTYRLWLTAANTARWNTRRPVLNNSPSDGTFVYNNYRVIYNMHPEYAGSPWHRGAMLTGPDGTLRVDFDIEMPEDDKFLGATDAVWNNPGNPSGTTTSDLSAQSEQTSYILFREIGVHYNYRRYMHLFVNGNQRSTTSDRAGNFIFEDSQQANGDVIDQWFPDQADGDLYKIEDWFEFPDNGDDFTTNNDADLQRRVVQTNGVPTLQTSAYRFMWRLRSRSAGQSSLDYSSQHEMVNAVSPTLATGDPINVQAVRPIVDFEQWMRVIACQHTAGNWDSYGYSRGKNCYTYKPNGGRFNLWTWDIDFTMGIGGDGAATGLFGANDPRIVAMWQNPEILRAYWRAYVDLVNGPLQNSYMDPILDAKAAALTDNNVNVNPSFVTTIKTFVTQRRAYIAGELAKGGLSNAPFTLRTPLTFTTNESLVTISGIANVMVKEISINGVTYPVTWTAVTNWSARVVLKPGQNNLQVVGGSTTQNVSITYTGSAVDPVGAVVLNELMYNPADPDASFVELYNRAAVPFDLGGWQLNGLDYTFPVGSLIQPGEYLVVAKNLGAFAAAYGSSVVPSAIFGGNFDPDGETISLIKPGVPGGADVVVDRVRYEAQAPWPLDAALNHSSLQLVDSGVDNSRPSAWAAGLDWQQVKITGSIGSSTNNLRVYLFLDSSGSIYIDDVSLVEGTQAEVGPNLLLNGDFESEFAGPWAPSTNNVGTVIDATLSHRGASSLKFVSLTTGSASLLRALTQPVFGAKPGTNYTLSFWYLPTPNANNITIRTAPGSALQITVNVKPIPASPGAASTLAASLPAFDPVWLNEAQPANVNGPIDNAGDRDPWVELFNAGPTAVDLSGYYLATSYTNNLHEWRFPAGTSIASGEFKVVWADGEPGESTPAAPHTSFRLSAGAGSIALVRDVGGKPQITDYLTYTGIPAGATYGDFPDGQPFNRLTMFGATAGTTNIGRSVDVYVNEWMASNPSFLADPADLDFDDWFELYNAGTNTVDLGGFYLTDDLNTRRKFQIPANGQYTIPPGGYLLVWADDEIAQNSPARPDLHANFQLSRTGESIALFAPDGSTVIDSVTFGVQTNNITQGRFPDGTANIVFLGSPSPRTANQLGGGNTAPTLQPIADRTILFGQSVSFTAVGADADVPAQTLTYSLAPGAPNGASIGAGTGAFTWTPSAAQVPGTNHITVRVTDSGVPPITVSQTFTVIVQAPSATFTRSGSNLQIGFASVAGKSYRIEYKNSLSEITWTPLPGSENIAGTGGVITVTTTTVGNPQRFFRIVQLN